MPDPTFDIGEDITHQRKVWRIERISWALMALAILATLLGFTGHGKFSRREATTENGLAIAYERFERSYAQSRINLRLPDFAGTEARIRVGHEFLRKVEVMRIEPEPERAELAADFTTYVFNASAAGLIQLHYRPLESGMLELQFGLNGEVPRTLSLFVYP